MGAAVVFACVLCLSTPWVAMAPKMKRSMRAVRRVRTGAYKVTQKSLDAMAGRMDTLIDKYIPRELDPFRMGKRQTAANWLDSLYSSKSEPITPELESIRASGKDRLDILDLPFKKDEAYRFMSLRRVYKSRFSSPSGIVNTDVLEGGYQNECDSHRLVFIDGVLDVSRSKMPSLPGDAYIGSINGIKDKELRARVLKEVDEVPTDIYGSEFWGTVNKAMLRDVAVIHLPEDTKIDAPIQLTFYTTSGMDSKAGASFPRLVVLGDKNSEATIYLNHLGDNDCTYYTSAVTNIKLEDNAEFNFYYNNEQSDIATHTEVINATLNTESKFMWRGMLNGGTVGRLNMDIDVIGDDAEVELYGASLATEDIQQDIHTFILHHAERGISKQEHRSIVGEGGECVFRGLIKILKAAEYCDADQQSRGLLLSPKGDITAIPSLVVEPDKVEGAAHGSTVSDLGGEEMFYMLTRGLTETQAKILLTKGFIRHIIAEFPFSNMKIRLMDKITEVAKEASVGWRETTIDAFDEPGNVERDEQMAGFA